MCDFYEKLKVRFLTARNICAKSIRTDELLVNGQNPFKETAVRAPLIQSDNLPDVIKDNWDFAFQFNAPLSLPDESLQSINTQLSFDNNPQLVTELFFQTFITYVDVNTMTSVFYNPTTRQWVTAPTDLTPFLITSVHLVDPADKIINLSTYTVLTNQEQCDILAKQTEVGQPSASTFTYTVLIYGSLLAGPFEPLFRTQYSAIYKALICLS